MRTVASGTQTAIDAPHATLCLLVELGFASGTVRLSNAGQSVTWNSETWTGLGNIGQIDVVKESATAEVTGIRFQIAAPLSGYLAIALNEHVQGAPAKIYTAFFDAGHQVVSAEEEWSGRIDTMTVQDSGETSVIQVTAEPRTADWQRPRVRRHNLEDHRLDYPTDRFYEYVPSMAEKEIVWPAASFFRK